MFVVLGFTIFRPLSCQTLKALYSPLRNPLRLSASRHVHTMQVPYSGPPTYETIARRFSSSQPDPQAFFSRKCQQEALERGEFTEIHDVDPGYSPDPTEYDVMLTGITYGKPGSTIAEELGIPYLSQTTEADANEVA